MRRRLVQAPGIANAPWGRKVVMGLLVVCVAILLGGCSRFARPNLEAYLNAHTQEVDKSASQYSRPVRFTIEAGMPARSIGQELQRFGLILDPSLFEAYVRVNQLDDKIQAGTYMLDPSMTMREIVEAIQHAETAAVSITIVEGWRLEQTADYLTKTDVLSDAAKGEAYRSLAHAGAIDSDQYPFLQDRPVGTSLEGYLYPDTYQLPAEGATAADVIARQLDTFGQRVAPLYDAAVQQGQTDLSLYEVLTLASIVEREAVVPEERPAIASVYLNRLAQGMVLNADPTVQYALGYQPASGQWWKTPVTLEEYSMVDSPYNTYLNPGLPPGPIAAPGLSSIKAVLNPDQTDYLYFVALPDGSGRHVFAKTFEEHQQNVARYQGQ
jgi:UPF0755 protein